jgi:hypothetical protein
LWEWLNLFVPEGKNAPSIPAEPQLYLLRMLEPETGSSDKLMFMDADT